MFRIYVGGLLMETNTFNPVLTTRDSFACWLEGEQMASMRGTAMELGGVYDCFDGCSDVEIVPGFFAQACTGGPVEESEFHYLANKVIEPLKNAGHVDGVLLVLHGAMQSQKIDDCEGFLIQEVRKVVGDEIPVCASFDFHTMLTEQIISGLSGLSGYRTYPHVDHFETGKRAAESLLHLLRTGRKPYCVSLRIPMIMSCENSNTIDSPMAALMERAVRLIDGPDVLSGALFLAQPWLDAEDQGCSICFYSADESKREALEAAAREILGEIWRRREEFYPPMPKVDEALERCRTMKKPICFVDYGDVPNAGGTGDGTVVLKALLEADLPDPSVVVVWDEKSTLQAWELGAGASADFCIGGFGKPGEFNERIPVSAQVVRLVDEPIVHLGPAMKGYISQPGKRALLRSGNVYIILCQRVCISHDRNMLISMGLDPAEMGIISMRATHSFMSCYEGVMGSWIYVDTPGSSARDLKTLPFRRCRRPIYPLDEQMKDPF